LARADLLINLVKANSRGDNLLFRRTLEAMIAEERAKQHHVLADRLAEFLNGSNGSGLLGKIDNRPASLLDEKLKGLFVELVPRRKLEELVLPDQVLNAIREVVEEQFRKDLLRAHGLEARNRVLLVGPPGNGKTSLAEALAEALLLPLIVVRYEGVIGSYLGETAVRLRRLFDYVRTRSCVLFFDEFDTLGKERGDEHETGEIKRVVSSLLLQIDDLPSHVLVVTATNHPELLDRAVWRRFQLRLELPAPGKAETIAWLSHLEQRLEEPLGQPLEQIAAKLHGLSYAELEELSQDILRRHLLDGPDACLGEIVRKRLDQWTRRQRVHPPSTAHG
jgi:SpoVK/Ycf46/Vps4 family AAA+-type ATPase